MKAICDSSKLYGRVVFIVPKIITHLLYKSWYSDFDYVDV